MARIQEIQRDLQRLQKEESTLKNAIQRDGNNGRVLEIASSGKYYKWFVRENGIKTYLPKAEKEKAAELAKSSWNRARLAEVRSEITACERYLKAFRGKTSRMQALMNNSGFCDLLGIGDETIQGWKAAKFNANPNHPEHMRYHTASGLFLRSKSEALIATLLEKYGIPFRYECLLETPDGPFYPDFTIMHPVTHRLYLWEHFGLMDSMQYVANVGPKVHTYMQAGYYPGDNLLMTFETQGHPLEPSRIEELIQENLLQK